MKNFSDFPKTIFSGSYPTGHCQGIAVDTKNRVIYYSFTTQLVKTDFDGNFLGSVGGLLGHLGCIQFRASDGLVYGSLEYKNDAIGKGIREGQELLKACGFKRFCTFEKLQPVWHEL